MEDPVVLTCPCPMVGKRCASCIVPQLGGRPPPRHPLGWLMANVGGRYWNLRGWLWGITNKR